VKLDISLLAWLLWYVLVWAAVAYGLVQLFN